MSTKFGKMNRTKSAKSEESSGSIPAGRLTTRCTGRRLHLALSFGFSQALAEICLGRRDLGLEQKSGNLRFINVY